MAPRSSSSVCLRRRAGLSLPEVGISPASVYRILTNSLGKRKVCAKSIPHMLNDNQRAMCVLLVTTHLQRWRNEGSAFLDCILMVDKSWIHSFDTQLKRQNAEWLPNVTEEENCMAQSGRSESHACHVLQPKWACA
jgi:hypothetical protein